MATSKAAKKAVVERPGDGDQLRRRDRGTAPQYDRLTQSQKRIAQYIVEHSQSVAFSTVDQMASQLDVNPSTIVRFTYRLGLNGFPDLQERMRELVRGQLSRTAIRSTKTKAAARISPAPASACRSTTTGRTCTAPSSASTRRCSAAINRITRRTAGLRRRPAFRPFRSRTTSA